MRAATTSPPTASVSSIIAGGGRGIATGGTRTGLLRRSAAGAEPTTPARTAAASDAPNRCRIANALPKLGIVRRGRPLPSNSTNCQRSPIKKELGGHGHIRMLSRWKAATKSQLFGESAQQASSPTRSAGQGHLVRAWSTPASIKRREITALAALECVVSFAIYVGIGLYRGNFLHFGIAVILAPLFLLRTRYSYSIALVKYRSYIKMLDKKPKTLTAIKLILWALCLPVVGISCRIGATVLGLAKYPGRTVASIPENWLRQSLCTDFAHVPEIVPGEHVNDTEFITLQFTILGIHAAFTDSLESVRERLLHGILLFLS